MTNDAMLMHAASALVSHCYRWQCWRRRGHAAHTQGVFGPTKVAIRQRQFILLELIDRLDLEVTRLGGVAEDPPLFGPQDVVGNLLRKSF
jgi:hypothetical protein